VFLSFRDDDLNLKHFRTRLIILLETDTVATGVGYAEMVMTLTLSSKVLEKSFSCRLHYLACSGYNLFLLIIFSILILKFWFI
jgi:hypothetical protein